MKPKYITHMDKDIISRKQSQMERKIIFSNINIQTSLCLSESIFTYHIN